MEFRQFFELPDKNYEALLLLDFEHDEESDWYEVRLFHGEELIGYLHGYGNRGWNPQVNNVWVNEKYRRKGIGSAMMSRVEDHFGQAPLPATRIEDNPAARGFWTKYLRAAEYPLKQARPA